MTQICVTIQQDKWTASTPNVPDLASCEGETEAKAVESLIHSIRSYCQDYESRGKPVPWVSNPSVTKDGGTITRTITGLEPVNTTEKDGRESWTNTVKEQHDVSD